MATMKPCPRCHSTGHLRIEVTDDHPGAGRSAKAWCTECNIFAQVYYGNGRRPGDAPSVGEVIERWNGLCDSWEGVFDHE